MRPRLKTITTIDGDNAAKFTPEDGESFSLWLRLYVGLSDGEGSESFDVLVCSPGWLAFQCVRDGFVIGRHHFVINEYRFDFIRDKLAKFIGQCIGDDWSEIAAKVARIGHWEFEDYVT